MSNKKSKLEKGVDIAFMWGIVILFLILFYLVNIQDKRITRLEEAIKTLSFHITELDEKLSNDISNTIIFGKPRYTQVKSGKSYFLNK